LGCETEFINIVNGFINRKKNDIDDTNDKNKENLSIQDNDHMALDDIGENTSKQKYICKVCGESDHNARNKAKCIKQD
ncbi:1701_t:CDS:2, partial [Funneliformis mosseae]